MLLPAAAPQLLVGSGVTDAHLYIRPTSNMRLTAGSTGMQTGMLGLTTGDQPASYTRTPTGTLIAQHTAGTTNYYLTDNLGTTVGLVDASGTKTASYAYDPYGVTRVATGTAAAANPFRYTGGQLDTATGLCKLGIRYYDPTLGRFTRPAPPAKTRTTPTPATAHAPTRIQLEVAPTASSRSQASVQGSLTTRSPWVP